MSRFKRRVATMAVAVCAAALAGNFNRMMGLKGNEFTGSGRRTEPSAAAVRAQKRLADQRAKHAGVPSEVKMTRQIRRAMERRAAKQQRQQLAAELRKLTYRQRRDMGLVA